MGLKNKPKVRETDPKWPENGARDLFFWPEISFNKTTSVMEKMRPCLKSLVIFGVTSDFFQSLTVNKYYYCRVWLTQLINSYCFISYWLVYLKQEIGLLILTQTRNGKNEYVQMLQKNSFSLSLPSKKDGHGQAMQLISIKLFE